MPKRLIITKVCFHITAALIALGVVFLVLVLGPLSEFVRGMGIAEHTAAGRGVGMDGMWTSVFAILRAYLVGVILFSVAAIVGIELVVRGLNQLRYWAWIVGIVICGLLILPICRGNIISGALGGLGLWGLVDPDSVKAFKPRDNGDAPNSVDRS